MIPRFIETYRKSRLLSKLRRRYAIECNDLACYKRSLQAAIRREEDSLSTALRKAISESHAQCQSLLGKIRINESWLTEAKKNNTTITTG